MRMHRPLKLLMSAIILLLGQSACQASGFNLAEPAKNQPLHGGVVEAGIIVGVDISGDMCRVSLKTLRLYSSPLSSGSTSPPQATITADAGVTSLTRGGKTWCQSLIASGPYVAFDDGNRLYARTGLEFATGKKLIANGQTDIRFCNVIFGYYDPANSADEPFTAGPFDRGYCDLVALVASHLQVAGASGSQAP